VTGWRSQTVGHAAAIASTVGAGIVVQVALLLILLGVAWLTI
jgi:hypothetical protein